MPVVKVTPQPDHELVGQLQALKRSYWKYGVHDQLALTRLASVREEDMSKWQSGCGSLPRLGIKEMDKDYWVLHLEAQFLQPLLALVASHSGLTPCRVRLMQMAAKTCLSYHYDRAPYRYHVPVETTDEAFFVVDDHVYRMRHPGCVYRLQTNLKHTAVNASFDRPRTHLVISVQ